MDDDGNPRRETCYQEPFGHRHIYIRGASVFLCAAPPFLISNSREAFKRNQGRPAPPPELPHKQKAHQMMGFLLVKLSIPGGNAVVTSMEQFSEKGFFPSYQSLTQETPFPVSRSPYFPSWTRWLFLRVSAVFLQTSDRCRRSFHDSSRSFRWRGLL